MYSLLKALVLFATAALCACAGAKREPQSFESDIAFDPVAACERVVYSGEDDSRTLACADVLDVWQ
jgi:hypothetical protein